MEMNRRTALLGLGAIATAGGAAFGSGAFSQVTADRSVTVTTAGDAAALLELSATDEHTEFVDQSAGTIEFNLDGGTVASGDGFNYKGVSYIEPLFEITNNGSETVGIRIGSTTNTAASIAQATVDGETGTNCFQFASGGDTIEMVFYIPRSGTEDTGVGFLDGGLETLKDGDNDSIVMNSFGGATGDTNLEPGAFIEIGFVIDATGVGSANIGAGTELLNEVAVVASGDGV